MVDVELKSGVQVTGTLTFVDNNMCMWLDVDENQLAKLPPQYSGLKNGLYIRGSAIRAVYMPTIESDLEALSDLCKKWFYYHFIPIYPLL